MYDFIDFIVRIISNRCSVSDLVYNSLKKTRRCGKIFFNGNTCTIDFGNNLGPAIFAPGLLGSLGVRPYKAAGSGLVQEKITKEINVAKRIDKILFIILMYVAKISFLSNKRI